MTHQKQFPLVASCATELATKAYADHCWKKNPEISPNSWRIIEGITVGKVGFFHTLPLNSKHLEHLMHTAFQKGVNLFVVSNMASQLILGKLLQEKKILREQIMLVAILDAKNLEDDLQLTKNRLNVEKIDVALINADIQHNELYATQEDINQAFILLESAVQNNSISFYGLASERLILSNKEKDFLDLSLIHKWARNAAEKVWGRKKRPLFRVLSLPFNLLEPNAVRLINTSAKVINAENEAVSTLELASRMHLSVLAMRPLAAAVKKDFYRLTQAVSEQEENLPMALNKVSTFEHELRSILNGWPATEEGPLFSFTEYGKKLLHQVSGRVMYAHFVEGIAKPQWRMVLEKIIALGKENKLILPIATSYEKASNKFFDNFATYVSRKDSLRNQTLENELMQRIPSEWSKAPLQEIALNAVTSMPSITCALCDFGDDITIKNISNIYEKGDFVDPAAIIGLT